MTTATGIVNAPLFALRDMFAESSEFQAWTSTASYEAALERCHVSVTSQRPSLPLIIIDHQEFVRERAGITQANAFNTRTGTAVVYFRRDLNSLVEIDEDYIAFGNELGSMLSGIEDVAGIYADLTLAVVTVRMDVAPQLNPESEHQSSGEFWEAVFALEWSRQPT